MDILSFVTILATILAIPATTYLSLKLVLAHLASTQQVGGLPKELRLKELEIASVQVEINKLKEETRLDISKNMARPAPINVHS